MTPSCVLRLIGCAASQLLLTTALLAAKLLIRAAAEGLEGVSPNCRA